MEMFDQTTLLILLPIVLLQIILLAVALVDWFKRSEMNGPRWLWLIIILFVNIIGPITYFIFGREKR